MQRIFPKTPKTAFLRNGLLQVLPSISELGIYGTFLSRGSAAVREPGTGTDTDTNSCAAATAAGTPAPLLSGYGGYLLRTKPDGVDEGGVASGYSVLNSIVLE
jgi:glutathione synthase